MSSTSVRIKKGRKNESQQKAALNTSLLYYKMVCQLLQGNVFKQMQQNIRENTMCYAIHTDLIR